jgi:putative membrane protein
MLFLWLKALHIFFVICWFAGIFYLPRLFVHHSLSKDAATQERLSIMEGKLYRFTTPIALLALVFGLALFFSNSSYYLASAWFHAKVVLVIGVFVYHFYCGHLLRVFLRGENTRSDKFYRIFNELPVLALLAIIILVVVRPF